MLILANFAYSLIISLIIEFFLEMIFSGKFVNIKLLLSGNYTFTQCCHNTEKSWEIIFSATTITS